MIQDPTIVCLGQRFINNQVHEWYQTATGHAKKRAEFVRQTGIPVIVEQCGMQSTRIGIVKLSLVKILATRNEVEQPPVIKEI